MSEGHDGGGGGQASNVCRDFIRNVCDRGNACKFKHLNREATKTHKLQDGMRFCHDFQNNRCFRATCKFIHASQDVEHQFRETGYLSPLIREQILRKAVGVDFPVKDGGVPVCKDFLRGKCQRGSTCKFRHMNQRSFDLLLNTTQPVASPTSDASTEHARFFIDEDDVSLNRKRPKLDNSHGTNSNQDAQERLNELQEENNQLRNYVLELETKMADLVASNDFLMEQNARLKEDQEARLPFSRTSVQVDEILQAERSLGLRFNGTGPVEPESAKVGYGAGGNAATANNNTNSSDENHRRMLAAEQDAQLLAEQSGRVRCGSLAELDLRLRYNAGTSQHAHQNLYGSYL